MNDLESCELCEWRCGVNRLKGQRGVCGVGMPEIVASMLHPAPPSSYDAFLAGCNFRCLGCQNYTISMCREQGTFIPPDRWAEQGIAALASREGRLIGADRLFFTGGEPTCSLPWVEAVAECCTLPVNFDTNGFMTLSSLERILSFSDSLTFDIKAVTPEIHLLLTGAPVEPVKRNCAYVVEHALEKVYEFRSVVYPGMVAEARKVAQFLANLCMDAPLCFLAFRPNFVLDRTRGTTTAELREALTFARSAGLHRVTWSGILDIPGEKAGEKAFEDLALLAGCEKPGEKRLCTCHECKLREYDPYRRT